MVGRHLGLLEQRRHQPVGDAAVGRTFPHAVDAGVSHGLHGVVHHDAAVHMQPHALGQLGVGADADGHHHQVGGHLAAVLEADGFHPAAPAIVGAAHHLLGLRAHQELQAPAFQGLLQQLAGHAVELALHQGVVHMHHTHVHAAQHQTIGRLQPQQAAADDHRVFVCPGGLDHGVGVGDVAVGDHPFQRVARHGQDEGVGSGAQQQAVVFGLGAVGGTHHAAHPVHLHHLLAGVQGDVVVAVPLPGIEHDLVQGLLACEHRRQQDAVVVGMGLGTEHRDVVQLGRNLQQLFERADTGHAITHHHQP